MDSERRSKPEIIPSDPQYWVKFDEVILEDLNAILGIYEQATGKNPAPIKESDFNKLSKKFKSPVGFAEWQITSTSALELRRLIAPDGITYVRFKISGVNRIINFKDTRAKPPIQEQIDTYFIDKKMAEPLSEIY